MARPIINHPKEPAHPMVVALHDNLVELYKFIREKYQPKIDEAFDKVSRQIGFVVTTTIPVEVEVADKGKLKQVTVTADNLKGTLFETIPSALSSAGSLPAGIAPGKYQLYLLWYPALKLKLRTDFMEPAHLAQGPGAAEILSSMRADLAVRFAGKIPFYGEPVHWLDPGYVIAAEEAVLIHAIDEVYPELRLADRISTARQDLRTKVRPEIPEPAHLFRPEIREPAHLRPEIREPAHFFRPGIREPAHIAQLEKAFTSDKGQEIAAEVAAVLRKYGF